MKTITITGQWLNTLPLPHTRPYMVGRIFQLAKERHWTVRIAGEHWEQ
jgi:hypothetical protein